MGATRCIRPMAPRFLLAALLSFGSLCAAQESEDPSITELTDASVTAAPIYLPHYEPESWSLVRGSIIASNATASETTYTIFCPAETPPACDLSLEFPFIIVGGPHTVKFHGTVTSTYIANVECELEGTTAATCSGYSSYKSGYTNGLYTGPTEVSWTSTLLGNQVTWGTLTMTETPTNTADPLGVTLSVTAPAATSPGDMYFVPSPKTAAGMNLKIDRIAIAATLALVALAGFAL